MAKIMNLVDPKVFQQTFGNTCSPPDSICQSMNSLDSDMQNILSRSGLTDREKVQQYNQVLQRYLEYHDAYNKPRTLEKQWEVKNPSTFNPENQLIEIVPPKLKRKAITLLNRIRNHPDMSWNEKGEFVYRGKVHSKTNVIDLINDTLRHRKTFEPRGWQDFARALREDNVPQDLVGNSVRWGWMQKDGATSDAFSTADEASPEITPTRKSRLRKRSPPPERKSSVKKKITWEGYK